MLGLIEDDISVHVSAITSENSLLEVSNASINSENSEAQTHTLSGLSLLMCVPIFDSKRTQLLHQPQCSLPME